jgi:hypothetical protein
MLILYDIEDLLDVPVHDLKKLRRTTSRKTENWKI